MSNQDPNVAGAASGFPLNKTQLISIATPLIGAAATWLASKVPLLDQATWNTLITSLALAGVTAVLGYFNRPLALKDTVGKLPATTVVTDAASANALPDNPDVVAATPEIVAAVKKAS